jgi:hypothetical protein
VAACRSCGASVVWVVTADAKRMPVDASPSPAGNVHLDVSDPRMTRAVVYTGGVLDAARSAGEPLHTSHFATCPHARSWRRG